MSYANLHPKYIFGLSGACQGDNVWFVGNESIMYAAGNAVVMLNLDQKSQSFLHGMEKQKGVSCICVSQSRLHAAVGNVGGDEATIAIFDLKSNKRVKILSSPEVKAQEYVSMGFSSDNLYLISLTGAPDYNCVLWKWDRSRVLAQTRATSTGLGPIYQISASPTDPNLMTVVGNACLKFFRYSEGHVKPFGFQRGDLSNFLCHAWYKQDYMLAGTADGKIMLFERGEYRHDIQIKDVTNDISGNMAERLHLNQNEKTTLLEMDGEGAEPETVTVLAPISGMGFEKDTDDLYKHPASKFKGGEITALAAYSKGFAAAYGVGNVVIFEEQMTYTSPEDHYKQMYVIKIPNATSECEDRFIKSLEIGPNEELMVATTYNCNIFMFQLSSVEIKEPEEMVFEYANCSYHFGAVLSIDVAIRKSLIVTCGADKFIRVWNFLTMSQEAEAEFAEEIYRVSIHPTGLFVLAGMIDKIRMFSVLLNDIRELRDWPIRGCKELQFSHGGHFFAAANGNILQLYSTTTLEVVTNMKGHSNKIRKIYWSLDDNKVISAGSDGAIYEWDLQTFKRTGDMVERGSKLISVATSPDYKNYFAINATHLKEMIIQDGMILKEVELGATPTCLAISRSGKILLAGFDNGTVRSFKQPLTATNEWNDYYLHDGICHGMICTWDEIYCISVGSDNTIIFWKMTDSDGRVAKLEKDLDYSSEVLVTRGDLDERQAGFNELRQKYAELKIEMDFALKRKDMSYQEEIRELNSKFEGDIEGLRARVEELEKLREKTADEYNVYLLEVKKHHQAALDNMEAHFNTKLISEFEKYNALQSLLEDTIKEYETRIISLEGDRGAAIEELVAYFESKVGEKNYALEQAYNDAKNSVQESEEMRRQIEEDADQEILELTTTYERKLRHEREMNAKLKGEAGIMNKKFQTMQKEIEERMNEVQRLHIECTKLGNAIKNTEREVVKFQKELVDSEAANAQKEKTIAELNKANSDLEKFKFVLEHRIVELRKNIEPKAREIVYLKQQNADMESELDSTMNVRGGFQLQLNELQNKLKAMSREFSLEKKRRARFQILLDRIRGHMSRCMSVLHDHNNLKATVRSMYEKYGEGVEAGKASSAEQEAICELVRQKNHLEISLTSVKRKLVKDAKFTRSEQLKIMQENMLLVNEINNLRAELKRTRDKVTIYETSLGLNQAAHAAEAAEMRFRLQHALEDRDEVDIQHEKLLEGKNALVEAQQEEIDTLSTKILKVHEYVHDMGQPAEGIGAAGIDHLKTVLGNNGPH